MKRCANCKSADVHEGHETVEVAVPTAAGPLRVRVSGVSAVRCGHCRESFLLGPDLARAELLAAREALMRGHWDGPVLRFARKALGLRATELGELLDVSAETVSRWENGHRVAERSVWNTVADLLHDRLEGSTTTLDRLRSRPARELPRRPLQLRLGSAAAR